MKQLNDEGLDLIKQWEGLKLEAYLCPAGVWTVGYGHTDTTRPNMSISKSEAERLLRYDLDRFIKAVNNLVKVDLTDNQFAALVSFCFNVGEGAFKRSTLLRKLNTGDYDAVPSELARWNKAGGKVVQGLTNRRAAETGLWVRGAFVSSNYVAASAPPSGQASAIASYGGIAAAAATAAPLVQAFSGVPMWVGVAAIVAATVLAVVILMRRA
jgi:lysozyme